MKFNDNKLYYSSDLELSVLRDIEIKKVIKSLEIPNIINKLSREVEEDLESEYNNNTIIINISNRYRFTQNNDVNSPY